MLAAEIALGVLGAVSVVLACSFVALYQRMERARLVERRELIAALLARTPVEFAAAVRERNGTKPRDPHPDGLAATIPEGL